MPHTPEQKRARRQALKTQQCEHPGCGTMMMPDKRKTTGLCQAHFNARLNTSPQKRAVRAEQMRAAWQNPVFADQRRKLVAEGLRADVERNPDRYVERGRRVGLTNRGRKLDPDLVARRVVRIVEAKLRDIPLEYRAEYFRLQSSYKLPRSERARIIRQQVDRDLARYLETGQLQRTKGSK